MEIITAKELADTLNVSVETIRKWKALGFIKGLREDGRMLLFNKEEIQPIIDGFNNSYSISEFADLTGYSKSSIYQFIYDSRIDIMKLQNLKTSTRIMKYELPKFIK